MLAHRPEKVARHHGSWSAAVCARRATPAPLAPIVDQVIAANAGKADEYRGGKTGLLGFFVGQVMRQSGGNANPALVSQLVQERLGG